MPHPTLRILRAEHAALAAVLRSVLRLLEVNRRRQTLPDFTALRAMLFYLDEFPEQRHHRKESALLFPKLRARTPLSRELLDRLDHDHALGDLRIRELEHRLLGFEMLGERRRQPFERAMQAYADFYFGHMALEERELLPLAERVLTAEDWADLDPAFVADSDPLTGRPSPVEYAALFDRITAWTSG